ncbi:MAG: methyltransferase, partial [Myxococcales bacterium]|nr:methyltransferase [Myxococcales bacterium]
MAYSETRGEDPLTDDVLTGQYRIFQRKRGHRYSVDDVVTAWAASLARPRATTYLDLGCGIGSVLLMVIHRLAPSVRAAGIEAQTVSHGLARRNLDRNELSSRVQLIHGDFRDSRVRDALQCRSFDLITGTPPYMPPGTSIPSPDSQRAYARVEYRGGVEAYLAAAAPLLAPDGRVVVCGDARTPARVDRGAQEAGLRAVLRQDVIPRDLRDPLFTVWTLGHRDHTDEFVHAPPLIMRDQFGARTDFAQKLRPFFGLPENPHEEP